MNKVILIGRMTKDPETRVATDKDLKVSRFNLAVDRRVAKAEQSADFISCVAFNKRAEFIEKYGRKGLKLVVEGRIQTGSYKNKNGDTVYTTDVVVEEVEFAESKNASDQKQDSGFEYMDAAVDMELPFN